MNARTNLEAAMMEILDCTELNMDDMENSTVKIVSRCREALANNAGIKDLVNLSSNLLDCTELHMDDMEDETHTLMENLADAMIFAKKGN